MSTSISVIKPGYGLGTIEFGSTREDVEQILGKPDEVENYNLSEEEGDKSEAWHFDDLEMSLSFEEFYDWQLLSIAVSGESYTLNGVKLIGKDKTTVIDILEEMKLGELEVDTDEDDVDMISIPELNINFWFEDDVLSEIQWEPIYDED